MSSASCGAMGTQLQAADVTVNATRPDVIEQIQRNYFEAVPKRSRRNTFVCNLVDPDGFDVADKIRELSLKGTAIAERVGVIARRDGCPDADRVTT
jgi:5-methyltetrahydrofolate--homocysteine methyltransferase